MPGLAPAALAITVLLAPAFGGAQVTTVDEGTFVITRGGLPAGREEFSIRSSVASGTPAFIAQARITAGNRRVSPGLNADTSGFVLRYQSEVRVDGRVTETYSGQSTRDHYSARVHRAEGESAREFRLLPGTVAADDSVVHQLWFIVRRGAGATVPVLVPGRNIVEIVRVEIVGRETLTFDVREVETVHLRLRTEGSGLVREVWTDNSGKVVKAAIPAERMVAIREF
jgi:hypothetical protein